MVNYFFFTNGCELYNKNFDVMNNGDTINRGNYYKLFCNSQNASKGLRIAQSGLVLPYKNENTYIMFHKTIDDEWLAKGISNSNKLNYSIIDMNKNNGLGEVMVKSKKIIEDTLVAGELTACRHANGQDWWILTAQSNAKGFGNSNNHFYTLLLKKDTILGTYEQFIGKDEDGIKSDQACFSPDGTKYARIKAKKGLYLYDFDRKIGKLSNLRIFELNQNAYTCGVSFSPNSKYIYASCDTLLFQFDATIQDIASSKQLIAEWDGFSVNGAFTSTFDMAQLAPDCKIYIAHGGTIEYLTVINYPNRKGTASGVEQHGLKLPTKIAWGLPNYPHFRLGAIGEQHTPCDSTINPYIDSNFKVTDLEDATAPPITVAVYPNPAQAEINVDLFGYVNRYKRGIYEIYNMQGQLVSYFPIFEGKSEYRYDISNLSNGMYIWRVLFDGKIGQTGKLVKME